MDSISNQLLLGGGNNQAPSGQISFTSPTYTTWTVPNGVTSISFVVIGGAKSGTSTSGSFGGGLAYRNNVPVTPGQNITVNVGDVTYGLSYVRVSGTATSAGGGDPTGPGQPGGAYDGGGVGGTRTRAGGGAGGYSGNGGNGGNDSSGSSGSGGGGGGGGERLSGGELRFGAGGGVGLYGEGASGSGGGITGNNDGYPGSGGSGKLYGGGGSSDPTVFDYKNPTGSSGAIRIIWPGDLRQFPSTRTADE